MSIVHVFGHKIRIVHFDEVTVRNAVLCCGHLWTTNGD